MKAEGQMQRQKQEQHRRALNKVGQKSSGKRKKCQAVDCIAMASPSGSGYCSFHERQALEVGQRTSMVFKCKRCSNAATPESEYCTECQDWLHAMNTEKHEEYEGDKPLAWGLGEEPLWHPSKAAQRERAEKNAGKATPDAPSAAAGVCARCSQEKCQHKDDCPVGKAMQEKVRQFREAAAKPKPVSPLRGVLMGEDQ